MFRNIVKLMGPEDSLRMASTLLSLTLVLPVQAWAEEGYSVGPKCYPQLPLPLTLIGDPIGQPTSVIPRVTPEQC